MLQLSLTGLHERLLQEGRNPQAALSHPNVCQVSDVVRVGGVPGLVMELVAGPTLDTLIANYQPSLPKSTPSRAGSPPGSAQPTLPGWSTAI